MTEYNKHCCYDNFPLTIVGIRLINLMAIMITGSALMYYYHLWGMIVYLAIAVIGVYAILVLVCRHCYYHGRQCDLALGLISGLISQKGNGDETFVRNAPKTYPFLAFMILPPAIAGIIVLVKTLSTIVLLVLITYFISVATLILTARELSCPHCKMKGICLFCTLPAEKKINY